MKTSNKQKSTSNKQQLTSKKQHHRNHFATLQHWQRLIFSIILFLLMGTSTKNLQAQFAPATITNPAIHNVMGVTHISCDGISSPTGITPSQEFKVFAWDGGKGTDWGYIFNGSPVITRSFSSTNSVTHPEIALVSDCRFSYVYAMIIYEDPINGVIYEFYKWNGTSFPTSPTYTGTLYATPVSKTVVSIAGDIYNHFAMICDKGYNTSTDLLQLTGYIDLSTGNIVFGTIGTINYSGVNISQPDIDITYDFDQSPNTDAVIAVAFTLGNATNVVSSSVDQFTLFSGTTWNSGSSTNSVRQNPAGPIFVNVDFPSVSLNDGFKSSLCNGFCVTRYGVAYHEYDGTTTSQITNYPVNLPSAASGTAIGMTSIQVGSPPATSFSLTNTTSLNDIQGQTNELPIIVMQPFEVNVVIGWNFINITSTGLSSTPLEGIANTLRYNFNGISPSIWNSPFLDLSLSGYKEMMMNVALNQTTEMAISGFSDFELLYFYYDISTKDLLYKTANFGATSLRKGLNKSEQKIAIYPNPTLDNVTILGLEKEEFYFLKVTNIQGVQLFNLHGNNQFINSKLNEELIKLKPNCYLLQFESSNRTTTTIKLLKQ